MVDSPVNVIGMSKAEPLDVDLDAADSTFSLLSAERYENLRGEDFRAG